MGYRRIDKDSHNHSIGYEIADIFSYEEWILKIS
jgi:hypothetical protein